MKSLSFAWRSLVRQPARAALGMLGVAAVGALLFDMLLLSQGLVVSMRDLLERSGFDVRVGAADRPGGGPLMADAVVAAKRIAALPSVRSVLTVRMADASLEHGGRRAWTAVQGVGGNGPRPWTILRGADMAADGDILVNESAARALGVEPGGTLDVRASCADESESLPPVRFRVAGVADFLFDDAEGSRRGDDGRRPGACVRGRGVQTRPTSSW